MLWCPMLNQIKYHLNLGFPQLLEKRIGSSNWVWTTKTQRGLPSCSFMFIFYHKIMGVNNIKMSSICTCMQNLRQDGSDLGCKCQVSNMSFWKNQFMSHHPTPFFFSSLSSQVHASVSFMNRLWRLLLTLRKRIRCSLIWVRTLSVSSNSTSTSGTFSFTSKRSASITSSFTDFDSSPRSRLLWETKQ